MIKIERKFFGNLILFSFIPFLIILTVVYVKINSAVTSGIIYGYLLSLMNVFLGYFSFELAFGRKNKTFTKIFFGGMILRMILLLCALILIIKFIGINLISLLFSLLIFYVINLIIELKHIIKRLKPGNSRI